MGGKSRPSGISGRAGRVKRLQMAGEAVPKASWALRSASLSDIAPGYWPFFGMTLGWAPNQHALAGGTPYVEAK